MYYLRYTRCDLDLKASLVSLVFSLWMLLACISCTRGCENVPGKSVCNRISYSENEQITLKWQTMKWQNESVL